MLKTNTQHLFLASYGAECYRDSFPTLKINIRHLFLASYGAECCYRDLFPDLPTFPILAENFCFLFIIYDFPPLSIIFRKNEIIDKCTCTCLQRKMAAYKLKLDSAGYDRI